MDKRAKLQDLKTKMQADLTLPLRETATQLVFGEGDPDSKIYFLGEAPGFYEDRDGRPFVGRAGQLLNKTLENIGLKREQVYISNIVRYRPPENRDPTEDEIGDFAKYIDLEIKIIQPIIIATLGRFSMGKFLPNARISSVHGQTQQLNFQGQDYVVLPMYHPAAALRATAILNEFTKDFLVLKDLLVFL